MKIRRIAAGILAVLAVGSLCFGGIRSEGKYCGVVIFDRWGGCTLYSGVYVMYISEGCKEGLRDQAGKCVEIDATKVVQEHNPGDGLIKEFKLLGAAPDANDGESAAGLKLTMRPTFKDGEKPTFIISVENVSEKAVTLHLDSLAPTVLMQKAKMTDWSESDGPSVAMMTREAFWVSESRTKGGNEDYGWTVTKPEKFEQMVELKPKGDFEISISYALPAGEYDLLVGYGGGVHAGQCIASSLIGIDVGKDGVATLAKVKGR